MKLDKVRVPRQLGKNFWTPEELRRFLETVKQVRPYYFPLVLGMFNGGLSQQEAFGLRFLDIDLSTSWVTLRHGNTLVKGKLTFGPLKGEHRERKFKLHPIMLREIQAIVTARNPKPEDFVFVRENGEPLDQNFFRDKLFYPLCKKAGVPKIKPHKTRKSAGTYQRDKGQSAPVLHQFLGHASYETTQRYYQGDSEESADLVNEAFDPLFDKL